MTFRRRDRAVVFALVTASLLGGGRPSLALAADPAAPPSAASEAADRFRHGVTLYKELDYAGALAEFRRAQELSPNYRVLYNVGQALYELQRYAEALRTFEAYLTQGGSQLSPARREAVEADLRALRGRVGYLSIAVDVDGAEVRVDDEMVGASPLAAPVLVSTGHRKISVTKGDRTPVEQFADVAAGDQVKVTIALPSIAAAAPAPKEAPSASGEPTPAGAPPPAPAPPPGRSDSLAWIPWTATGVLAAGTAVTGVLTLTSKSSLSTDLATFPGNPSAIDADRSHAKTFSVASDVLLAATAVSLGAALYVTFRSHDSAAATGAVDVKVRLGLDGLRLEGAF